MKLIGDKNNEDNLEGFSGLPFDFEMKEDDEN